MNETKKMGGQSAEQIMDRYNAKKEVFLAMVRGRRISLLQSREFEVAEMHTTICCIRKDIAKKELPYVMRDRWIRTQRGKRIKEYWLEKSI